MFLHVYASLGNPPVFPFFRPIRAPLCRYGLASRGLFEAGQVLEGQLLAGEQVCPVPESECVCVCVWGGKRLENQAEGPRPGTATVRAQGCPRIKGDGLVGNVRTCAADASHCRKTFNDQPSGQWFGVLMCLGYGKIVGALVSLRLPC